MDPVPACSLTNLPSLLGTDRVGELPRKTTVRLLPLGHLPEGSPQLPTGQALVLGCVPASGGPDAQSPSSTEGGVCRF